MSNVKREAEAAQDAALDAPVDPTEITLDFLVSVKVKYPKLNEIDLGVLGDQIGNSISNQLDFSTDDYSEVFSEEVNFEDAEDTAVYDIEVELSSVTYQPKA